MAEMPPLYSPSLDVIQPHNSMGDVQPNRFLLPIVAARSKCYNYFDYSNNWHHIAFRMGRVMVYRNSYGKLFYSSIVNQAKCATRYPGILTQSAWDGYGRITSHTYRLVGIAYQSLT